MGGNPYLDRFRASLGPSASAPIAPTRSGNPYLDRFRSRLGAGPVAPPPEGGGIAEALGRGWNTVTQPIKSLMGLSQSVGGRIGALGGELAGDPGLYDRAMQENLRSITGGAEPTTMQLAEAQPGLGDVLAAAVPEAWRESIPGQIVEPAVRFAGNLVGDPINIATGGIAGAARGARAALTGIEALPAGVQGAGRLLTAGERLAQAGTAAARVVGSAPAGAVYAPEMAESVFESGRRAYDLASEGRFKEALVPAAQGLFTGALGGLVAHGARADLAEMRAARALPAPPVPGGIAEAAARQQAPSLATEALLGGARVAEQARQAAQAPEPAGIAAAAQQPGVVPDVWTGTPPPGFPVDPRAEFDALQAEYLGGVAPEQGDAILGRMAEMIRERQAAPPEAPPVWQGGVPRGFEPVAERAPRPDYDFIPPADRAALDAQLAELDTLAREGPPSIQQAAEARGRELFEAARRAEAEEAARAQAGDAFVSIEDEVARRPPDPAIVRAVAGVGRAEPSRIVAPEAAPEPVDVESLRYAAQAAPPVRPEDTGGGIADFVLPRQRVPQTGATMGDAPSPEAPGFVPEGGYGEAAGGIEAAARAIADRAEPTEAQKESGNYRKGHVRLAGMDVSIENAAGSKRRPEWPTLNSHYGYVRGTTGKDGDHVDVFVRPGTPEAYEGPVFVVNQTKADGSFDEHKALIGFDSEAEARAAYEGNYTPGAARYSGVASFENPQAFRAWLAEGNTKQPAPDAARGPDRRAPPPRPVDVERRTGGQDRRARIAAELPGTPPEVVERIAAAEERAEAAETAANTDPLTGLGNRRAFDAEQTPGHFVSFDVAGLKWFNDTHGHPAGDALLKAVAEAVRGVVRDGVKGFRTGGDEFYLTAPTRRQAEDMALLVKQALARSTIKAGTPDGRTLYYEGARVDYGYGEDAERADNALVEDRKRQDAAGERAARGSRPAGLVEVPASRHDVRGDSAADAFRDAEVSDEEVTASLPYIVKTLRLAERPGGTLIREGGDVTGKLAIKSVKDEIGLAHLDAGPRDIIEAIDYGTASPEERAADRRWTTKKGEPRARRQQMEALYGEVREGLRDHLERQKGPQRVAEDPDAARDAVEDGEVSDGTFYTEEGSAFMARRQPQDIVARAERQAARTLDVLDRSAEDPAEVATPGTPVRRELEGLRDFDRDDPATWPVTPEEHRLVADYDDARDMDLPESIRRVVDEVVAPRVAEIEQRAKDVTTGREKLAARIDEEARAEYAVASDFLDRVEAARNDTDPAEALRDLEAEAEEMLAAREGREARGLAFMRRRVPQAGLFDAQPELPLERPAETRPNPAEAAAMPTTAALKEPITGRTGAAIVGYEWRSMTGEKWSEREGGMVRSVVSDWNRSDTSTGTGRDIVHVFYVRHPDGRVSAEGVRSAQNLLDMDESRLRTIATRARDAQAAATRDNAALVRELEAGAAPDAQGALVNFRARGNAGDDAFRQSVLLEKGGKFIRSIPERVELLESAGWTRAENQRNSLAPARSGLIEKTKLGDQRIIPGSLDATMSRPIRTEGREREGPLFTQERDAQIRREEKAQGDLFGEPRESTAPRGPMSSKAEVQARTKAADQNPARMSNGYSVADGGQDALRPVADELARVADGLAEAAGSAVRRMLRVLPGANARFEGFTVDGALNGVWQSGKVRGNVLASVEWANTRIALYHRGAKGPERTRLLADFTARHLVATLAHEAAHGVAKHHGEAHVAALRRIIRNAGEYRRAIAEVRLALLKRSGERGPWVVDSMSRLWEQAEPQWRRDAQERARRDAGGGARPGERGTRPDHRPGAGARHPDGSEGGGVRPARAVRGGDEGAAREVGAGPAVRDGGAPVGPPRESPRRASGDYRVNPDTLSREVLARMDKRLRSMGYDSRGAQDVRRALKEKIARDGEIPAAFQDWRDAYDAARGGAEARQEKAKTLKERTPHVNWERVRKLGTTSNPVAAGYIRPDGALLDLSGGSGTRGEDHRIVGGTAGMQEIQAAGYIRWMPEANGLDLSAEPTPEQFRRIQQLVERANGEVVLDLEAGLGEYDARNEYYRDAPRKTSLEYPAGTRASKIIGDIRRFFAGEDLPSGPRFSTRQRQDAPAFFSALQRAVDEAKPTAASGSDWLRYLSDPKRAVKADELKWTGADDYLRSKGTARVTREELSAFVRENEVRVEEVTKGGKRAGDGRPYTDADVRITETEDGNFRAQVGDVEDPRYFDSYHEAGQWAQDVVDQDQESFSRRAEGTKFGQYTLPGGENYREVLLTLPKALPRGIRVERDDAGLWHVRDVDGRTISTARNREHAVTNFRAQRGLLKDVFHSSHFDEPNVLAHVRLNDRTDADGKRVLFVEEIQSDWAQKGRREGFNGDLSIKLVPAERDGRWMVVSERTGDRVFRTEYDSREAAARAIADTERMAREGRVPNAPFVDSTEKWTALALKRVLRMAAEGGYDRVAWTTGEQQAARYDLSKQVDHITYDPRTNKLEAFAPGTPGSNRTVISETVPREKLADYIGKEAADKLLATPYSESNPYSVHTLLNADLKVGGEGMKGFYDRIVPSVAAKLGKKWGARVGRARVPLSESEAALRVRLDRERMRPEHIEEYVAKNPQEFVEAHSIDVTPAMGRSVLDEGQPLFMARRATAEAPAEPPATPPSRPRLRPIPPRSDIGLEGARRAASASQEEGGRTEGKPPEEFINLNRIAEPDDVKEMESRVADALKGELAEARSYRSWEEARVAAVEAGLTEADFRRLLKEKGAVTDVEILAGRRLRETAFKDARARLEELRQAERDGEDAGDAEAAYEAAIHRAAGVMWSTVRAGAEAGRALAIHRKMSEALTPQERLYRRVAKERPGLSEEFAKRLLRTDPADHRAQMELLRAEFNPRLTSMAYEFWINGLLSGPPTHLANITGNLLTQLLRIPERAIAGAIGRDRHVGEAYADIMGIREGMKKAMAAFRADWTDEFRLKADSKLEHQVRAIPGRAGSIVRTPTRLLSATDEAFKALAATREARALAYRKARREGKTGKALAARIEDILANLQDHEDIAKGMKEAADYQTFTKHLGRFGTMMIAARDADPTGIAKVIAPFMRTPMNIAKYTLERTPLNFVRLMLSKEARGDDLAEEFAKPILGTLLGIGFALAAQDGLLTGGGPSDQRENEAKRATGWQPYSFHVGDQYVSFQRFEPLSSILGFAADMVEAQDEKTSGDLVQKIVGSVGENLTNKTFLQGVENFFLLWSDPRRYASQWAKSLEGSVVPALFARVAQAIDPTVRETRATDLSAVQARIPFASRRLEPRRRGTGEPITRGGTALERFASPAQRSTEKGPEADLERQFLDVDYVPSRPERYVTVPGTRGRKAELTDAEYRVFTQYDEAVTARLRRVVGSPAWKRMSAEARRQYLENAYQRAGRAARARVLPAVARRARSGEARA